MQQGRATAVDILNTQTASSSPGATGQDCCACEPDPVDHGTPEVAQATSLKMKFAGLL